MQKMWPVAHRGLEKNLTQSFPKIDRLEGVASAHQSSTPAGVMP